ncbi:MAG: acetyl-CoA carboxylase, biotin carboxyl carrier protein [Caldisericia bacterium]|nr:acetyl-CoA carboxylase, biotin carboxyl carrier protein [Caldisericia bacterium]MDD4614002.1 acetyl-CoA carboxylase, biotin carboxyl carrier protein [Caldisericia bacterium]
MNNDKNEVLHQVKNLIQIMKENATKKVHIETKDWKISIEQKEERHTPVAGAFIPEPETAVEELQKEQSTAMHTITTPLVGTFYRSPSPQSDPYVEIGDVVQEGQVLCIVEAMKVMNEIHSDVYGVITNILAQTGDMVEFGQSLFEIEEKDSSDEA